MLSDQVRRRLEKLNRTATHAPKNSAGAGQVDRSDNTISEHQSDPTHQGSNASANLAQGQVVPTPWGEHLLIQQPVSKLWPRGPRLIAKRMRFETPVIEDHEDLFQLQRMFPQQTLFLDLETCGFAGSLIFLAGVLHEHHGELYLSQLWARTYAEEKALLHSLWTLANRARLLVTFNGKSFDWPQVHDRSTLHHLGDVASSTVDQQAANHCEPVVLTMKSHRPSLMHFDLLHHARRRWKRQLPNCKLQTLERYICGRHRVGDIPGKDIPSAYHDYVRTGNVRQVRSILHHNALDLVTLLQLSLTFIGYRPESEQRIAS